MTLTETITLWVLSWVATLGLFAFIEYAGYLYRAYGCESLLQCWIG